MRISKYLFYYLLLVIFVAACNDNSVSPEYPIEDSINSNRPFERVVVHGNDFTLDFSKNDPNSFEKISDAYAEKGYFVLIISNGSNKKTYFFSLQEAKKVQTSRGQIYIIY